MSTIAYGWELTAPSTSGGKVYQITVIDNIIVTGWGSTSTTTRQFMVEAHVDSQWASRWAVERTAEKESRGYSLTTPPHAHEIDPAMLGELRRMVGHRGASARLQQAFNLLIQHGRTAA
jgi:predicted DNA-binding WGR domain protein